MGRQPGGMCSPESSRSPRRTTHPRPSPLLPTSRRCWAPAPRRAVPRASWHRTVAKASSQSPSPCHDAAAPLAHGSQSPPQQSPSSHPHEQPCKDKSSTAALSPPQQEHCDPAGNTLPEAREQTAAHAGAHTRVQRAEEPGQGHALPKHREGSTSLTAQPSLDHGRERPPTLSIGRDNPQGSGR